MMVKVNLNQANTQAASDWPAVGVNLCAAGVPFGELCALVPAAIKRYGVGVARLIPRLEDGFDWANEIEEPDWLTIPARELDLDPKQCADYAAQVRRRTRAPYFPVEPINEGYTASAFGTDEQAWLNFHKLFYAEMAVRGVECDILISPRLGDETTAQKLGALPSGVDVHSYGHVPGQDSHHLVRVPSRVSTIDSKGGDPIRAVSVNHLSNSHWGIHVLSPKAGKLYVKVGGTFLWQVDGEDRWRFLSIPAPAYGPCTLFCAEGAWQSVEVARIEPNATKMPTDSAAYFRWVQGNEWVQKSVAARIDLHAAGYGSGKEVRPYEYVRGWKGSKPPMSVMIGEGCFSSFGLCHTGLAASLIFLGRYADFMAAGADAVHLHGSTRFLRRPTVLGQALEWFRYVRQVPPCTFSMADAPQGFRMLPGRDRVLLLNPGPAVELEIDGMEHDHPSIQAMVPNDDLSAAWQLEDVRVGSREWFSSSSNGSIHLDVPTGITLLRGCDRAAA